MAKPTKVQQRDLNRTVDIIRRQRESEGAIKRSVSRGIAKQALHKLPDIEKAESDSGFTKENFESDLIKASKRIKETKPSPKSS